MCLKVSGEVLGEDFRVKPGRDGKQLMSNRGVQSQRSRWNSQHLLPTQLNNTARHAERHETQLPVSSTALIFLF